MRGIAPGSRRSRPTVQLLVPAHQRAVGDRLPGGKRRESFSLRVQMEWKGKEQPTQSIRKFLSELNLRGHHPGKLLDVCKVNDRA